MESLGSLRESITSIPGALSNFVSESASFANSYIHIYDDNNSTGANATATSLTSSTATPTPTSIATDECSSSYVPISEKSLSIPASLIKEQWRLIFTSDANAQDLEAAIAHCRDLVLLTDECSEERRWLVRHLVDLRYSLKELQDAQKDPRESGPSVKTVVGHHFVVQQRSVRLQHLHAAATTRNYCDHCTGIIWSVVQTAYICSDCRYLVHQNCVDSVVRICAHIIASERQYPIAEICPEIGLAAQRYKCQECETLLNFKNSWIEPRLCDYTGLYFCPSCHWNDNSIIPARVVHNWDFVPRKVSRAALQEINLFLDKPLVKLEEANPKLFVFLEKLGNIKKLRQKLVYMRKYLVECRKAIKEKILDAEIGSQYHLIISIEFYSFKDLEQTENGSLIEFLNKMYNVFDRHIRNCDICTAKAYICEICSNIEVIYPFDDVCIICDKCNSIYHRVCMTRKNMICPKCKRLHERKMKSNKIKNKNKKDVDNNNDDADSVADADGDGDGDYIDDDNYDEN